MKLYSAVSRNLFFIVLAFQIETQASVRCETYFQLAAAKVKSGSAILHEKDPLLHKSDAVARVVLKNERVTGEELNQPAERIDKWLQHLTRFSKKAQTSPDALKQIKALLFEKFVIKKDEIPENYYDLEARIARERGEDEVILTKAEKKERAKTLIKAQKKSLETWINYLNSKDSDMYPMWIKYWAFTGMTKLSKYNPETGTFGKRDPGTVAPFPDLNREALAQVIDVVMKFTKKESLADVNDQDLLTLLPGLNFGKLYGHALLKIGSKTVTDVKTVEGQWVVFPKGSNHKKLVKALSGKNTGWCTAGESTAKSHLSGGDFHIFFSLDENGQPTIPRVAIRMEKNKIAEVRGTGYEQNLDRQMTESSVISMKMKEFGDEGVAYIKKDRDMKMLTQVEKAQKAKRPLTKSEIGFIYELQERIEGFGSERDQRIEEIKAERNLKDDVVWYYDNKYSRDEITTTMEEVLAGKSKVHFGTFYSPRQITSTVGLKLPEILLGDLWLDGLKSPEGLVLPHYVRGLLSLRNIGSVKGLKKPGGVARYQGPSDWSE